MKELTDEPVRNVTGDTTAPVLQSAAVDSPLLTLTYDEAQWTRSRCRRRVRSR